MWGGKLVKVKKRQKKKKKKKRIFYAFAHATRYAKTEFRVDMDPLDHLSVNTFGAPSSYIRNYYFTVTLVGRIFYFHI